MAEQVKAVVDGDHHHVAALAQAGPLIGGAGAGSRREAAAVEPQHHRPLLPVLQAWGPDVEEQTVLAHRRLARRPGLEQAASVARTAHGLRRLCAMFEGVAHPGPGLRRLGRGKSGGGGVGAVADAEEDLNPVLDEALHLAGLGGGDGGRGGGGLGAGGGGGDRGGCAHYDLAAAGVLAHGVLPGFRVSGNLRRPPDL